MTDPRDRFSNLSDLYHKYRPTYPAGVIDYVLSLAPRGRVADLGCGTGISTRLLAAKGRDVVGIDPNESMLDVARREGGTYVKGEAVATGLPDRSVALVTAAQAFHWFDIPKALTEIARILEPGGWSCAFWNLRATTPFLDAYEALLLRYSKDYKEVANVGSTIAALRAGVKDPVERRFRNAQPLDHAAFFGRVHSSSYVKLGVTKMEEFDAALEALFQKHEQGGSVVFDYDVDTIAWRAEPR